MSNFQFYPADIKQAKPIGQMSVKNFVEKIKNPNEKIKDIFKQIAAAELAGDMDLKSKLKQENLFYFTPCIFVNWEGVEVQGERGPYISHRCYKNIKHFTGLAVLDFDHIDNAPEFRDFVFNKFDFIIAAFLSSSKRGVKFLIKIPVAQNIEEFKSYFYGLGYIFDKYKGFDGSAQNCVLPLFLAYDPGILYRDNASTFKNKGAKLDAFKISDTKLPLDFKPQEGDAQRVTHNIKKAFDNIINNGHPQVVAASVSLGGYVASGYISQNDAEALAFALIESNNYLKKGVAGYKKTAKSGIVTGMQSALIL